MTRLSSEDAKTLPIFKVWADGGTHPPVALDKPVCVIGRNEVGVNLPLHSPQVSKLHAVVVRTQRKVYVRDLASRNGVQRNGAPVQEVGLSDEDVLRIGSYTLRCASGFGHAADPDPDDTGAGAAAADAPTLPAAELVATNAVRSSCSWRCCCPCSSPLARSCSTSVTGTCTRSICRRWSTPARSRRRRSSWAARSSSEIRLPRTMRSAR